MLVSKSPAFQHHGVLRTTGVTTLPSASSSRVITPKAPSALLSCAQQDAPTKKRPFYSRLEVFNALSTGNVHQAFFKISILLLGSSFADPFLLSPLPAMAADPSRAQIQQVQRAFQAFNDRDLRNAEVLFDQSVQAWEQLERPRDEMAALVKARGNVKVDLKKFEAAIEDFDRVLSIMSVDGTKTDGSGEAAYSEYPDVFVQRGLAWVREGGREGGGKVGRDREREDRRVENGPGWSRMESGGGWEGREGGRGRGWHGRGMRQVLGHKCNTIPT